MNLLSTPSYTKWETSGTYKEVVVAVPTPSSRNLHLSYACFFIALKTVKMNQARRHPGALLENSLHKHTGYYYHFFKPGNIKHHKSDANVFQGLLASSLGLTKGQMHSDVYLQMAILAATLLCPVPAGWIVYVPGTSASASP